MCCSYQGCDKDVVIDDEDAEPLQVGFTAPQQDLFAANATHNANHTENKQHDNNIFTTNNKQHAHTHTHTHKQHQDNKYNIIKDNNKSSDSISDVKEMKQHNNVSTAVIVDVKHKEVNTGSHAHTHTRIHTHTHICTHSQSERAERLSKFAFFQCVRAGVCVCADV